MAHRFVTAIRATGAGSRLRHVVTVGLPVTLLNLVAGGLGAAVGPARAWRRGAFPTLPSRPLVRPQLSSQIGITRLRDPRIVAGSRWFAGACARAVAHRPARRRQPGMEHGARSGRLRQPHPLVAGVAGASQPLTVRRNDGTTDLERARETTALHLRPIALPRDPMASLLRP
jgi:hypothetical protein